MYDPEMTQPMREELTRAGVEELLTPADVDAMMKQKHPTLLLFINSVCGCAGSARPALIDSLKQTLTPAKVVTVFAGVDSEATEQARSYITDYSPSSPSIALFRDGMFVHMIERKQIEGCDAAVIATTLRQMFDRYCGPEIDEDVQITNPIDSLLISPQEVQQRLESGDEVHLIDCRTIEEYEEENIQQSRHLDQELLREMESWSKDSEVIIHCMHGVRSMKAVKQLRRHGFTNVKSLDGGLENWKKEFD